jgi:hypothetical protein
MATNFTPMEILDLYCRSCKKVLPGQLERSIADSGRTINKDGSFEYFCSKCNHTTCYTGKDLLPAADPEEVADREPRDYSATEHYLIGETISHKSFKDTGKVVGKDQGEPSRIQVLFEKNGLKKLVEDVG